MPKSAKLDAKSKVHADETAPAPEVRTATSNGYDGKKLLDFVNRVEECQGEIDGIMLNAQDACAPHRDDIAAIKKEAAESGFSKTEFATILRKRRLEKKVETIDAKLDDEQKEVFDLMMHALDVALGVLSDTPLGQAATAAAAANPNLN